MAPRRKPPATTTTASTKAPSRSALAKTHNLTAEQETAISEAFHLFSYPSSTTSQTAKGKQKEREIQVLPPSSVRRALVALNAPPASAAELKELLSILVDDPEGAEEVEGEAGEQGIPYERFIAVAALKVQQQQQEQHSKGKRNPASSSKTTFSRQVGKGSRRWSGRSGGGEGDDGSDDYDDEDEDEDLEGDDDDDEEVRSAYALFTQGQTGREISLRDLRRVARELREDVSEDVLRDMIREAKGGGDGRGTVGLREFSGVMGRAGVW